jgi:hypothetical protein
MIIGTARAHPPDRHIDDRIFVAEHVAVLAKPLIEDPIVALGLEEEIAGERLIWRVFSSEQQQLIVL